MWKICFYLCISFTIVLSYPKKRSLEEGDLCMLESGNIGKCRKITDCHSAIDDMDRHKKQPVECSTENYKMIVCCDDLNNKKVKKSVAKSPESKIGRIARKKCEEYSNWIVPYTLIGEPERRPGICGITIEPFIVGGDTAGDMEFPHMAHLGYKVNNERNLRFLCGASLISKEYLLTAAHCLITATPVVARLGTGDTKSQKLVRIKEIKIHPKYEGLKRYNDIALLRLAEPIEDFTDFMRPACIHTEKEIRASEGVATGWGSTKYKGSQSEVLMKVGLPFQNHSECSKIYNQDKILERGIDDDTHLCAGTRNVRKDTCQGDSGGPLQVALKEPECMYSIVGVTSFGIKCGINPGVYTRVSNYVSWIESIVWPNE